MEPMSRDLDIEVAEKVLKWRVVYLDTTLRKAVPHYRLDDDYGYVELPYFSREWSDVQLVAEALGAWQLERQAIRDGSGRYVYSCFFYLEYNLLHDKANEHTGIQLPGIRKAWGSFSGGLPLVPVPKPYHHSKSLPEAVCLAALAAVTLRDAT